MHSVFIATMVFFSASAATVENFRLTDQDGVAQEIYYYGDLEKIVIVGIGQCDENIEQLTVKALNKVPEAQLVVFVDSAVTSTRPAVSIHKTLILHDNFGLIGPQLGLDSSGTFLEVSPTENWKVVERGSLNVEDNLNITNSTDRCRALSASNSGLKKEHSYAVDVAPILVEKCVPCHQQGGIGPWSMTDYNMIRGFAPMIREVIRTRRMPPFYASEVAGGWKGDPGLDRMEARTLVEWIEDGAPRGSGHDPLVKQERELEDWPLGPPDLVVTLPEVDVPASGQLDYVYPVVPNPLEQEVWLRASVIKPSSTETVHHVLSGYMYDEPEPGYRWESAWRGSVGSYTPGQVAQILPANHGARIPAGGYFGFQVHYTPIGRPVKDTTLVGLYFYDTKPRYVKRSYVITDTSIEIPSGEPNHREFAHAEFPNDALLYTIYPHAHYRGRSVTVTLLQEDGSERQLLHLPSYHYYWQRDYDFEDPVFIPKGSRIITEWTYDNSARNVANPDADANITWGDQTDKEMFYVRLNFRWLDETSDKETNEYERLEAYRLFGTLDDNIDGQIKIDEVRGPQTQRILTLIAEHDRNGDGALQKAELVRD